MSSEIVCTAYPRSGIVGNPSDQFEGKTIAASLSNFQAQVKLLPSEGLVFVPNPEQDPLGYSSLESLNQDLQRKGYYGGVRLLKATCNAFYKYCKTHRIRLERKNFTMSYETTIPRQLGLAGSSAIVCAEKELGITAGLQDRVVQVYGGTLFMDFSAEHLEARGRGQYSIKQKWLDGDSEVKETMSQIADTAEKGCVALLNKDYEELGKLMDENFNLRRSVYGDAIGRKTLRMTQIAKSVGAYANNSGSGGSVLALCPKGQMQVYALTDLCTKEGFKIEQVVIAPKKFTPS